MLPFLDIKCRTWLVILSKGWAPQNRKANLHYPTSAFAVLLPVVLHFKPPAKELFN